MYEILWVHILEIDRGCWILILWFAIFKLRFPVWYTVHVLPHHFILPETGSARHGRFFWITKHYRRLIMLVIFLSLGLRLWATSLLIPLISIFQRIGIFSKLVLNIWWLLIDVAGPIQIWLSFLEALLLEQLGTL